MAERRNDEGPVDYIDCEIPRDMTLREYARTGRGPGGRPPGRLRAVAAAMGRAARLRRRP
jgi:hypothetical protein